MKLGICIPATQGREHNLQLVLSSIRKQGHYPETPIVVVDDGGGLGMSELAWGVTIIRTPKHEPGMEQPRNIGVRHLATLGVTHVWFLDSDVVIKEGAYDEIMAALRHDSDRILVAPYDWLEAHLRPTLNRASWPPFWSAALRVRNDPRWEMFHHTLSPDQLYNADLSAGLACFSGNLVWPVDRFEHVGGFWSEIHHGRCEDGELGLRAVAMEVPISLVAEARGFHLWHPVHPTIAQERNARDVPMLNARHPWVEAGGLVVVERDGKRFDQRCPCGELVNTGDYWNHAKGCGNHISGPIVQTEPALILPDALR